MIMEKSARKLDLDRKSEQELKDLLENQEKLLSNKKLVKSLPDQGKKIKELVDNIRKVLSAKASVDDTADRLSTMRLGTSDKSEIISDQVLSNLTPIINRSITGKIVTDERKNFSNSYEFIMKQNSNSAILSCPDKFTPHRLLQDKSTKTLSSEGNDTSSATENISVDNSSGTRSTLEENVQHNSKTGIRKAVPRRLKHRYDECLEELFPYERRFSKGVQMVALEESIELLNKHQTELRAAELKRAEAMLAASSDVKLMADKNQWQGEKFSKYRDDEDGGNDQDEDESEDDEENNVDYGDHSTTEEEQ